VLQCVAGYLSVSQCVTVCCSVLQCVAVVLQYCCSVFQSPRLQHFKTKVLSSSAFSCCSCLEVFVPILLSSFYFQTSFFLNSRVIRLRLQDVHRFLYHLFGFSCLYCSILRLCIQDVLVFFVCKNARYEAQRMLEKRPTTSQKRPTYTQKETYNPAKVFCVCKNARYEAPKCSERGPQRHKIDLHIHKRNLHTHKSVLCLLECQMRGAKNFKKRVPQCHKRDLYTQKRPINTQKRPKHAHKRDKCTSRKSWQESGSQNLSRCAFVSFVCVFRSLLCVYWSLLYIYRFLL